MSWTFNPFTKRLDKTGAGSGGSGSASWGSITGTLSAQADLQSALDAKIDENAPITPATKTKITYDADGLVTSGTDATTADIADSTDRRYVTDAESTVIDNTSGTNTGDQVVPTQEVIEDYVGGMVSSNTETGIAVTYDDTSGKLNFDAQTAGDARYAPIAKGVTNGDSHDHSGGDGAQIDHGGLAGLADDDHPQYRLESEDHSHQSTGAQGGKLDHGLALNGLSDDDHSQYLLADGSRALGGNWDMGTGTIDAGDNSSFEIPNSAAPTVDADGEIAFDTTVTDFSTGLVRIFGNEAQGLVSMPVAEFTSPLHRQVPTYNSTNDEFELNDQLALFAPQGFLLNGMITTAISSNDLVVSLKTLANADPSAADPVYCRIGNTVRTITSALSKTLADGTSWFNSGSTMLGTREIDYFVYLGYNATDGVVLGFARIPYARRYGDFSATTTNQNYAAISTITTANSADEYENIGRFNAVLSLTGTGHLWTIPATSIILNRPCRETRWLSWLPTYGGTGSMTFTSVATTQAVYYLSDRLITCQINATGTTGGTPSVRVTFTVPFERPGGTSDASLGATAIDAGVYITGFIVPESSTTCGVGRYDGANWGASASDAISAILNYNLV